MEKPQKLTLKGSTLELNEVNRIICTNLKSGIDFMMSYQEIVDITDYMDEPDRTLTLDWLIAYNKYMESDD